MSRGSKKGVPKRRPGRKMGTCGKCPCCMNRAAYMTKTYKRSVGNKAVSDEELERRMLAKPLW